MREKPQDLPSRLRGLALPLIIGILLLTCIAFGMVYLQQQREQTDLKAEIAQLNTEISRPLQTSSELEGKHQAAKQSIPTDLKEEDVIIAVLGITESLGFDTSIESSDVSISSDQVRVETVEGSNYRVLPFHINIRGDHDRVIDFIHEMDSTSMLKTLVLKEVSITIEQSKTSASLDFDVYTLGE